MVPASGNEGEKEGTKGQENKKGWRTRSTKKESGLREGREEGGRGKGGGEGSVGKAKRKRPRSRGTCARRRAQTAANDEGVRRADCGRGGCLVEARGEGRGQGGTSGIMMTGCGTTAVRLRSSTLSIGGLDERSYAQGVGREGRA